jgi:peptidoglycan/xylan/chitin deacetylase (PgdA/CDA1 family)
MIRLFRPPRWIEWFYPSCTWRLAVSGPVVFLTFDDGPHPDITPFVLDELRRTGMKATFFCVGENLLRYPEITERILNEGHAIGNHTMRHTKGTAVSDAEYFQSVEDFTRHNDTRLFRPPYGKTRRSQRAFLGKRYRIVMWSWLSYDYDKRVPVEKILRKAQSIRKGDILVLHDNPKIAGRQKELLPELLALLEKKGLRSDKMVDC